MTDSFRTDDARDEPDQLRDQVRQLFRHRGVMAAGLLVGLGGGLLLYQFGSTQYTAEGSLVVRDVTVSPFDPTETAGKQVNMQTETQVAGSLSVTDAAASALREPGVTGAALQRDLAVSVSPDSEVLGFAYTADDPAEAAKRDNALMTAYLGSRRADAEGSLKRITASLKAQLKPLETRYDQLAGTDPQRTTIADQIAAVQSKLADYQAVDTTPGQVIAEATPPTAPAGVGRSLTAVLGGVAGLALGVLLAWLLSVLESGVRDDRDVRRHLGAPVLGELPLPIRALLPGRGRLLVVGRRGRLTEAYRTLALHTALTLDTRPGADRHRSVLVVEPRTAGHAAQVAANLAAVHAEDGEDVVLIEADLRDPRLADRLAGHLDDDPDTGRAGGLLVNTGGTAAFSLVPGRRGNGTPHALAAIGTAAAAQRAGHTVVVCAPAVLDYPDALAVARWADGVIVVCPREGLHRDDLDQVRRFFDPTGTPVLGAVLLRTPGGPLGRAVSRVLRGGQGTGSGSRGQRRYAEPPAPWSGPTAKAVPGWAGPPSTSGPGRASSPHAPLPTPDDERALAVARSQLEQTGE